MRIALGCNEDHDDGPPSGGSVIYERLPGQLTVGGAVDKILAVPRTLPDLIHQAVPEQKAAGPTTAAKPSSTGATVATPTADRTFARAPLDSFNEFFQSMNACEALMHSTAA